MYGSLGSYPVFIIIRKQGGKSSESDDVHLPSYQYCLCCNAVFLIIAAQHSKKEIRIASSNSVLKEMALDKRGNGEDIFQLEAVFR